jgi:glyoxylase I family protein
MTRFVHVNLTAKDWRRLSRFYREVFGCVPAPPVRRQQGPELERGTGVANARLEGEHLRLPGFDGSDGPTLEIYAYDPTLDKPPAAANRAGFGHLAFEVDDVGRTLEKVLGAGGGAQGEVVSLRVPGKGTVTFVYARDPEDNLIELQSWSDAGV